MFRLHLQLLLFLFVFFLDCSGHAKNCLFIDLGNTCAKFYELHEDGTISEQRSLAKKKSIHKELRKIHQKSKIDQIWISSVVPFLDSSTRQSCQSLLECTPIFVTEKISNLKFHPDIDPKIVGTDLICSAKAATSLYPKKNSLIVSFGTATTVIALSKEGVFLGVTIAPGTQTQMKSLHSCAKLPQLEISIQDQEVVTQMPTTTEKAIKIGVYLAQLGGVIETCRTLGERAFPEEPYQVIATGGYLPLYAHHPFFKNQISDLVFKGLRVIANHSYE